MQVSTIPNAIIRGVGEVCFDWHYFKWGLDGLPLKILLGVRVAHSQWLDVTQLDPRGQVAVASLNETSSLDLNRSTALFGRPLT